MATFADMATLLMAFFVLILSFAEMNVPKYKQITGSLKAAFGVQRLVPVVEPPKAQSLIAQEFSPAVSKPTPQQVVKQETTDQMKKRWSLRQTTKLPTSRTMKILRPFSRFSLRRSQRVKSRSRSRTKKLLSSRPRSQVLVVRASLIMGH